MKKHYTREDLLKLLREKQGDRTAKQLAEELGITPQYLSDVFLGKRDPGESILEGLGLKKSTKYEKVS
jgi:transcriptional regulator with XRE-family HTH domain